MIKKPCLGYCKQIYIIFNNIILDLHKDLNPCALIYKRLNGNTPEYINDLLIRNSDTHNRSTCFCNINLMCPRFKRITDGGRAFAVQATKEWNKLSVDIKQSTWSSVKSLKRSLFKIIIDNQILSKLFL